MSQQRLEELDEIVEELLIFSNVDTTSMGSCNEVSISVTEISRRECDYVYFSLRLKSDDSYTDAVNRIKEQIIEAN